MGRTLGVALVQHPSAAGLGIEGFAKNLRSLVAAHPGLGLWVFPELHLDGVDTEPALCARPLADPLLDQLGELAKELGVWLVPGTIYERGEHGQVHNTAVVFSATGERVASYRKMFPWRPAETSVPGGCFEVFELPGYGRVGLSICYDIWFPEHTRHLAWAGSQLVLNLVLTATSDREQELAIVRGNAIMNQVWIASVNAAAPSGRGRSIIVDPNGTVRASSPDASAEVLTAVIDFAEADTVREYGTAAVTRPWAQFRPGDAPIALPLYGGGINPETWNAQSHSEPG
jgi:predicted amidohydrolase